MIWGTFILTHATITAVPFFGQLEAAQGMAALVLVFPALAMGVGTASLTAPLWLRVSERQTFHIVRWALAEAATLFGLAGWFNTGSYAVLFTCAGIGLLAHLAAFPRGT